MEPPTCKYEAKGNKVYDCTMSVGTKENSMGVMLVSIQSVKEFVKAVIMKMNVNGCQN